MKQFIPFTLRANLEGEVDVNPATRPEISLYGKEYALAPINEEELAIFNVQFPLLLAGPGSIEREIQLERQPIYMMGMRAIKMDLKNRTFRGLNPGDTELGFGRIRPQFCKGTAYLTNWQIALTAATWVDWLYSGADTGFTVGEDFGLVITHLMSLVSPAPFVSELHAKIGRTDLIPTNVRPIKMGDNENGIPTFPIPTMFAMPKEDLWVELLADISGTEDMELGGIVVGLGRVLKETSASWS